MKNRICRLISLLCVFVIVFSIPISSVNGEAEPWGNPFAYALNDAILLNGTIATESTGDFIDVDTDNSIYPQGIIYADLVKFKNDGDPYLCVFRSDSVRGAVSVDIYEYDKVSGKAKLLTVLSKGYKIDNGIIREVALGHSFDTRYIVFNEYRDGQLTDSQYYTIIDKNTYLSITTPEDTELSGVVTYTNSYLHPEVDVAYYNDHLSLFFSSLKDMSADDIEFENIADKLSANELERLSRVLKKTTGFSSFDIHDYKSMSEYSLWVKEHDGEGKFNSITHMYDLGDEMYYVRYSTDLCLYNGTILRRTDRLEDMYQILLVRNDFIPFNQKELMSLKDKYLKYNLVLQQSASSAELDKDKTAEKIIDIEKKIDVPKKIPSHLRTPIALVGGGVCLGMFVLLWVIISSNKDDK